MRLIIPTIMMPLPLSNATLTTKALQAVTTTGGVDDLEINEASRPATHQQSGRFEALDDVLAYLNSRCGDGQRHKRSYQLMDSWPIAFRQRSVWSGIQN